MGTRSIKVSSISSPIVSMREIRSKKKMKERDSMPDLDKRRRKGTKNLESNFVLIRTMIIDDVKKGKHFPPRVR